MFLNRLFALKPEPAPAPQMTATAARLALGIELHSAFANGCVYCREPIGEVETCVIFRRPLRMAHIDCHFRSDDAQG